TNLLMRKLVFIFLFLAFIHSTAQNGVVNIEVGPVYKALISELDDCIKDKERDCPEMATNFIEKGIYEKYAINDYLYIMNVYHFFRLYVFQDSILIFEP